MLLMQIEDPHRKPLSKVTASGLFTVLTLSLPITTKVPYANSLDPDETRLTRHLIPIQAV